MTDGIVQCVDCGHSNAAERHEGALQPVGVEECPTCGGAEFAPVTAETTDLDAVGRPNPESEAETD